MYDVKYQPISDISAAGSEGIDCTV